MDVKERVNIKASSASIKESVNFNRLSENLQQAANYIANEIQQGDHKGAVIALFKGTKKSEKGQLAREVSKTLRKDIYRVDLSQMISKYIGETEKNIDRVLHNSNNAGVILFFDEADALFGKRSQVEDAHDRYANQETAFLLAGLERYSGLVIISTQSEEDLDPELLRHVQFVIDFDKEN